MRFVAEADAEVCVRAWEFRTGLISGKCQGVLLRGEHQQHGAHAQVITLCWATDSCRVYSACSGGLVVELTLTLTDKKPPPPSSLRTSFSIATGLIDRTLGPLQSAASMWMMKSGFAGGSKVVYDCPGERVLQVSCAVSEVSCGHADLLLLCTDRQVLLFHFPRDSTLRPRCSELSQRFPRPTDGDREEEIVYAGCFSSGTLASSVLVTRSCGISVSALFCNTNGIVLQEFRLTNRTPPNDGAVPGLFWLRTLRWVRPSLLVAEAVDDRVLLLDLGDMALQMLIPTSRRVLVAPGGLWFLQGEQTTLLRYLLLPLPQYTKLPLNLVSVDVPAAVSVMQLLFRAKRKILNTESSGRDLESAVEGKAFSRLQNVTNELQSPLSFPTSIRVIIAPLVGPPTQLESVSLSEALGIRQEGFEVEVNASGGLGLSMVVTEALGFRVNGFSRLMGGGRGALELGGRVEVGDMLVSVDGVRLAALGIEAAVGALRGLDARCGQVLLGFEYTDADSAPAESPRRHPTTELLLDVFTGLDKDLAVDPADVSLNADIEAATSGANKRESMLWARAREGLAAEDVRTALLTTAAFPSAVRVASVGPTKEASGFSEEALSGELNAWLSSRMATLAMTQNKVVAAYASQSYLDLPADALSNFEKIHLSTPQKSEAKTTDPSEVIWLGHMDINNVNAELSELRRLIDEAMTIFKRRSGRGVTAAAFAQPPQELTVAVLAFLEQRLFSRAVGFESVRELLLIWSACFSPSPAAVVTDDTRDLMTLLLVLSTAGDLICTRPCHKEHSIVGLPRFNVYVGYGAIREGVWSDRVVARFVSQVGARYLHLPLALATCSAVNYSHTVLEVMRAAPLQSLDVGFLDPSLDNIALEAIFSKIYGAPYLNLLVATHLSELAFHGLLPRMCALAFPSLRPSTVRMLLETQLRTKNWQDVYWQYLNALMVSDVHTRDPSVLLEYLNALLIRCEEDKSEAGALLGRLSAMLESSVTAGWDVLDAATILRNAGHNALAEHAGLLSAAVCWTEDDCTRLRAALIPLLVRNLRDEFGGAGDLLYAFFSCVDEFGLQEAWGELCTALEVVGALEANCADQLAAVMGLLFGKIGAAMVRETPGVLEVLSSESFLNLIEACQS
jgi:hypothetical protein